MPAIRRCVNPRFRLYVYFPWVYVQNGSFGCMSAFRRTFEAPGPGKVNYSTGTGMTDLICDGYFKSAGLTVTRVPYRDVVRPMTDLGENRIQPTLPDSPSCCRICRPAGRSSSRSPTGPGPRYSPTPRPSRRP